MKSVFTKIAFLMAAFILTTAVANAQMTAQTVTINPGYTNQTFYSMANGTVSSVSNTDWDLGFQLRGYAASILINSKNNVRIWKANKDATQWPTMVIADTTGIVSNTAYQLYNSDTTWDFGALNTTNNPADMFDLGWGEYDLSTHVITGDSIYFLQLSNGDYKKLWIENLASGVYNFRWADLDGSNETPATLTKNLYTGKFFAYYSITNNVAIDREPLFADWDLVFNQYESLTPFIYKVTGVLSNAGVQVLKAYPVDTATATYDTTLFVNAINTIGYNWKVYDFNLNAYVVTDSTVYFVRTQSGGVWKMIFTGFGGSANGNFYFNQGPATMTGIIENSPIKTFGMYPNPARGNTHLMLTAQHTGDATITLVDLSGRIVSEEKISLHDGLQTIDLSLGKALSGLYQVVIRQGADLQVSRLIVE